MAKKSKHPLGFVKPGFSFKNGGNLPKAEIGWISYGTNPEYFDNRAVYDDNEAFNDQIRRLVYAGTHEYNPELRAVRPLNKKVNVPAEVKRYSQQEGPSTFATSPELRKKFIQQSTEKAFHNPLMTLPGLVGTPIVPAAGLTAIGLLGAGANAIQGNYKTAALEAGLSMLPLIPKFTRIDRQLAAIEKEGLDQGLSSFEIAKNQLEKVGITSNQRAAYVPGVSEFVNKYVTPVGYAPMHGNKVTQTLRNIVGMPDEVTLSVGNPRKDAWALYLGLPQKNNTFRMAETAPINHPAYSPKMLKDMDIYSLNFEDRIFENLASSAKNKYPNQGTIKRLREELGYDYDSDVMGGYNTRLTNFGSDYNDIWDLNPRLNIKSFFPTVVGESKILEPLFYKKRFLPDSKVSQLVPRGIDVPIKKVIGKPFMSHGYSPRTWDMHKAELLSNISGEINKLTKSLKGLDADILPYRQKELSNLIDKYYEVRRIQPPTKKTGGVIDDPAGQWAHPGKVTRIPSNQITMKGVNYPVLGIDNTGYKQMMMPGGEYTYPGTSVTEYPVKAQLGMGRVMSKLGSPWYELKDRNFLNPVITQSLGTSAPTVNPFDYNDYRNKAASYIGRPVFKGATLNPDIVAKAAKQFYDKTGYNYPIELLLSQAQFETGLGKNLKSKHNYFNVGNTDSGETRDFSSQEDSILNYLDLMYNDYLNKGKKSPSDLVQPKSFVNYRGSRYASAADYEDKLRNQMKFITKFWEKKQVGGPYVPQYLSPLKRNLFDVVSDWLDDSEEPAKKQTPTPQAKKTAPVKKEVKKETPAPKVIYPEPGVVKKPYTLPTTEEIIAKQQEQQAQQVQSKPEPSLGYTTTLTDAPSYGPSFEPVDVAAQIEAAKKIDSKKFLKEKLAIVNNVAKTLPPDTPKKESLDDIKSSMQLAYYDVTNPDPAISAAGKVKYNQLNLRYLAKIKELNEKAESDAGWLDSWVNNALPSMLSKPYQKYGLGDQPELYEQTSLNFETYGQKKEKEKQEYLKSTRIEDLGADPNNRWRLRASASNDNPLIVIPYGNRGERKKNPVNIQGRGTLMHFLDQSPTTGYMHKTNKTDVSGYIHGLKDNDYIGVLDPVDKAKGEYALKYIPKKQFKEEKRVWGKDNFYIRQVKFDDIDFNKKTKDPNFDGHTYWGMKTNERGLPISSGKNEDIYNYSSGQSVVFIYPHNGQTRYNQFSGSPSEIRKEAEKIKKEYDLKKGDLTIGVADAGSYSSNIKSSSGVITDDLLNSRDMGYYNPGDYTGAGMVLKKQGGPVTWSIVEDIPKAQNGLFTGMPPADLGIDTGTLKTDSASVVKSNPIEQEKRYIHNARVAAQERAKMAAKGDYSYEYQPTTLDQVGNVAQNITDLYGNLLGLDPKYLRETHDYSGFVKKGLENFPVVALTDLAFPYVVQGVTQLATKVPGMLRSGYETAANLTSKGLNAAKQTLGITKTLTPAEEAAKVISTLPSHQQQLIRQAQDLKILPIDFNPKSLDPLFDPSLPNSQKLLENRIREGIENQITAVRSVTPPASNLGVAQTSTGRLRELDPRDVQAMKDAGVWGDPLQESIYTSTHVPYGDYGMKVGTEALSPKYGRLYYYRGTPIDELGKIDYQYGPYTVKTRIPFEYKGEALQWLEDFKNISAGSLENAGRQLKPGQHAAFGPIDFKSSVEGVSIGYPGQQVLQPISVSYNPTYVAEVAKMKEKFTELNSLYGKPNDLLEWASSMKSKEAGKTIKVTDLEEAEKYLNRTLNDMLTDRYYTASDYEKFYKIGDPLPEIRKKGGQTTWQIID